MFISGSHRYNSTFNYKKWKVVASIFSVCCETVSCELTERTPHLHSPRNERNRMQEVSSTAAPLPLTDGLHFWNTCVSCSAALLSKGFFPQLSVSVMSITRLGSSVMADWRRCRAQAAFVILSFSGVRRLVSLWTPTAWILAEFLKALMNSAGSNGQHLETRSTRRYHRMLPRWH